MKINYEVKGKYIYVDFSNNDEVLKQISAMFSEKTFQTMNKRLVEQESNALIARSVRTRHKSVRRDISNISDGYVLGHIIFPALIEIVTSSAMDNIALYEIKAKPYSNVVIRGVF